MTLLMSPLSKPPGVIFHHSSMSDQAKKKHM